MTGRLLAHLHARPADLSGALRLSVATRGGDLDPLVVLGEVHKRYHGGDDGRVVLDGVSLEVVGGEVLAILGPSGCGKTTLLNVVGGLDDADSGTVRSCGTDLAAASATELTRYRAHSVGFVFQFYNLLPTLTAMENVVAGVTVAGVSRHDARARADHYLERVGLGGLGSRFPSELSGGEQQRVAIARAVAKEPRLLLADEPTGNLDEDTAAEVRDLLVELNASTGITMMIVTHNPAVASAAGRVVRLVRGRIAEEHRAETQPDSRSRGDAEGHAE